MALLAGIPRLEMSQAAAISKWQPGTESWCWNGSLEGVLLLDWEDEDDLFLVLFKCFERPENHVFSRKVCSVGGS